MKKVREESGQSILEFALILPLLLLLALVPVDFFRYAVTRMNLESAAVDALNHVTGEDLSDGTKGKAEETIQTVLLNLYTGEGKPKISFDEFILVEGDENAEYPYYVYFSDRSGEDAFGDRFEKRFSNYSYYRASLQLSCDFKPVTLLGKGYFLFGSENRGDERTVTVYSSVVRKDIFAEGYRKKQNMEE